MSPIVRSISRCIVDVVMSINIAVFVDRFCKSERLVSEYEYVFNRTDLRQNRRPSKARNADLGDAVGAAEEEKTKRRS
jgi:hypothetical protein